MALGKYLYCIIRCAEERTFDGVTAIGEPGGPVHSLTWGELAAVASDSSTERYDASRAHLLAHERVIEAIMREQTVLPVRFGTVARSESPVASVQRLLERRAEEFNRLLCEMEGKVELGLKALWRDEDALFEEIVTEDGEIRALRDALRRRPDGASARARIRLGEMVKAALARKRAGEATGIISSLRGIADRIADNTVLLDRMILNTAFLVRQEREVEFDRAIASLDEELGPRIRLRYTGPVAPYNFVRIVVNWEEIRAA